MIYKFCLYIIETCRVFIDDWVKMAETVKAKVIAEAGDADFSEQCERCARVDNQSELPQLSYTFVLM